MLAGLEMRERGRPLGVAVEMVVVDGRHPRVVEVAGAVPDAVLLLHPHVAHLDRQEVLERGLPDAALVDVGADPERRRADAAVARPRTCRASSTGAEVELEVVVPQEPAPSFGCAARTFSNPPFSEIAQQFRDRGRRPSRASSSITAIFRCRGMVADLRDLHHGRGHPARNRVRGHQPLDRALSPRPSGRARARRTSRCCAGPGRRGAGGPRRPQPRWSSAAHRIPARRPAGAPTANGTAWY